MNTQQTYIAYTRTSTSEQQLGLIAQLTSIQRVVEEKGGIIIQHFSENVSGSKSEDNGRVELKKALDLQKETGAIIIVDKLDRLSRKLSGVAVMYEAGIKLLICEIPDLNPLMIGIYSGFACMERNKISMRTKVALQALKDKGVKLGRPTVDNKTNNYLSNLASKRLNKAEHNNISTLHIKSCREAGMSWREVLNSLNTNGYTTSTGKQFNNIIQAQRLM